MKSYAHQERAVAEGVADLSSRGFHAWFMEVGTGKSKVLIDTIREMHQRALIDSAVIVGPKSLVGTWREQLGLHHQGAYRLDVYDAQKSRGIRWYRDFSQWQVSIDRTHDRFPFLFVNTEAFQSPNSTLLTVLRTFTTGRKVLMAIDESAMIKSPDAVRSKALAKLAREHCQYRTIMTGTEITNSVLDLYQQFEFLSPGFWGFRSFFMFKSYFAVLEERYLSGGRTYREVVGFQRLDELQSRIAPFVSRARKKDCLDLPPQVQARLPFELSGECERVYREMKARLMAILESGEVLTVANKVSLFIKFRQITGGTLPGTVIEPRPAKLAALLDDIADHGEQAIIWSCFREETGLICEALNKEGYTHSRFDGSTDTDGRELAIQVFRSGGSRFFVANPAAASQGLNLQCASLQYWYSLPTQVSQLEQGEGRTHRSGQTQTCVYKRLVALDSVDERVSSLLDLKMDISSSFKDGTIEDVIKLI